MAPVTARAFRMLARYAEYYTLRRSRCLHLRCPASLVSLALWIQPVSTR
jgi:hypothetical protein